MSSTGATLSGSYTGATSSPTSAGFKYGTTSGNLTQTATVSASGTSGNLSATLSGLDPGKTYYYQAFVTVNGTGDYASQSETFYGSQQSFKTKAVATATVTTDAATGITSSAAVLNGHFEAASGTIYETGFYWGTSQNSLTNQLQRDGMSGTSGSFAWTLGETELEQLAPNTTYYFRAYVLEFNEETNQYVERLASNTLSFKTAAANQTVWQQYLSGYGMPDVSGIVTGLRQTGTLTERDDKWYSVNTSNSKRQIAIHTYAEGAPNDDETLNYVVLYDADKYAPVWTAHTMNTTYWPNLNAGRNDSWTNDPAISLTQQTGLDNADGVGYSRGHLVASEYRQTSVKQNKQTFYYSNQAPQYQVGFNGGVWATLESKVASIAPSGSTMLYVVTGVLYDEDWYTANPSRPRTLPSGSLTVPIPSHFYKCLMFCWFDGVGNMTKSTGIAFLMSNEPHTGNNYAVADFVTSIDAIEELAGFNFFASVPSAYQTSAESNRNWNTFATKANISSVFVDDWGTL